MGPVMNAARRNLPRALPVAGFALAIATLLAGQVPRSAGAPPPWTSPGTGVTVTPAYLVTQGAMADLGGSVYTLDRTLNIQAADTFQVPAGTTIRPTDVAAFLDCAGPVEILGTAASPVTLGGSVSSWQGLHLNLGRWTTTIRHTTFQNTYGTALLLANLYSDRASVFQALSFTDASGVAVRLQLFEPRVRHTFENWTMTRCGTSVMLDRSAGVTIDSITVTAPTATTANIGGSPSVPAAFWIAKGGGATTIRNATVAETGLWALAPSSTGPDPDSIHLVSCRFTGTGKETAIALQRGVGARIENCVITGYAGGIDARSAAGLEILGTTLTSCARAVHLAGIPRFSRAETFAISGTDWLEIAQDGSLPGSWQFDAGGNFRSPAGSGGRFPFQSVTYETLAVFSKGHARLLATNAEYDVVKNNIDIGRQRVLGSASLATIFALPDDLESDPDTSDLHGHGLRTFSPGQLDAAGQAATETVTVLEWYAPTAADTGNRANRIAVHLHPDGRVRWLWREIPYTALPYGFAAGLVSAGGGLEVLAALLPTDTRVGYRWYPGLPETGTIINGCMITGSTIGLSADTATRLVINATAIVRNTTGVVVNAGLETVSITASTIASNGTDLSITATTGRILAENSYLGSSNAGNTGLLVNSNPSATPLLGASAGTLVTGAPNLCLLEREAPGLRSAWPGLRAFRECLLASRIGRFLVDVYHAL